MFYPKVPLAYNVIVYYISKHLIFQIYAKKKQLCQPRLQVSVSMPYLRLSFILQ